jgi:hypothetical protein
MNYDLTSPCSNCPFRSDKRFHLAPGRVREIGRSLVRGDFPRHKTTVHDDSDDSELVATKDSQHCAGALILLEKLEQPSQMMRVCERIGMYDARQLKMDAPVYESWEAMQKGCR